MKWNTGNIPVEIPANPMYNPSLRWDNNPSQLSQSGKSQAFVFPWGSVLECRKTLEGWMTLSKWQKEMTAKSSIYINIKWYALTIVNYSSPSIKANNILLSKFLFWYGIKICIFHQNFFIIFFPNLSCFFTLPVWREVIADQ